MPSSFELDFKLSVLRACEAARRDRQAWAGGRSSASYELFLDILKSVLASRLKVTLHSSTATTASSLRQLMRDLGEADTDAMSFAACRHPTDEEEPGKELLVHTQTDGSVRFFYERPAAGQEGSH